VVEVSASNWARCPRCARRTAAVLERRAAEIRAKYGKVSVEEFEQMSRRLQESRDALAETFHPTFREDYEIYGAETGTVKVSYSGGCVECGLRLDFKREFKMDLES
jgi:hypothetical protein